MKTLWLVARSRRHSRAEQEVDEGIIKSGSQNALSSFDAEDLVQQLCCSDQFPPLASSSLITVRGNQSSERVDSGFTQRVQPLL